MRIVLADLKGGDGFISKDTVAGGYGSRLRPFSRVTGIIARLKRSFHDIPSVHLAYAAALAARAGHNVVRSRGEIVDGDVALVLSSLVDYRRETAWARAMRRRGVRVGFIGLASARLPRLFEADADFIVDGEPEAAVLEMVHGDTLSGIVESPAVRDLDALPFPRWDRLLLPRRRVQVPFAGRPVGGSLPVLASRSCPEFCTYCPHRIQAPYRARTVGNILDELSYLADTMGRVHVVFRDPLFTQSRGSGARALRRHLEPRAPAHLRVRDAARSARRALVDRDAARRAAGHELRRGGGVAGDAEEGRPPSDSRDATSARCSPSAARSAS